MMPTPQKNSPQDSMTYALHVQQAASGEGFDWTDISGVLDKVAEELAEIREALAVGAMDQARNELGDLFLAAISVARFLHVDPQVCLAQATERFERRMALVRILAESDGTALESCSPEALDVLWERAKQLAPQQLEESLDK